MGLLLFVLDLATRATSLADRLHHIGGDSLRQAHLRRGGKGLVDAWIHSNHHVLLRLDELISIGHLILHPRLEAIFHYSANHVANPGLGGLVQLLIIGQICIHDWIVGSELPDLLEFQLFILGDLDEAHRVALNV